MTATTLIRAGEAQPMQPWPRYLLSGDAWRALTDALRGDPKPAFLGLWADTAHVHALFMADAPLLASVRVEAGRFDALSPGRPAAAALERMVHDLWGHAAANGRDARPLLDHGRWSVLRPLSGRPASNDAPPLPPQFLGVASPGQHQIPMGPIGSGVLDPVHLRITAGGEIVARMEARLGYAHRGILALMRGKPLRSAAQLAARIAADSAVAHAVAFARACEAALGIDAPPRGQAIRGVMAELERIASHLADLGGAMPGPLGARCGALRETVLRANQAAFGQRLLLDAVVPGGTSTDLAPGGEAAVLDAVDRIAAEWPALLRGVDRMMGQTAGMGVIGPDMIEQYAPGGVVGRAAGRTDDARLVPGYPPYDRPRTEWPEASGGDVDSRLRLRLSDIRVSQELLREWLGSLPPGPVNVAVPNASGEGLGVAEGPAGDIWHWLRLDAGTIATNFGRDPHWLHWPLIEAACCGAALGDLPLILRSFGPAVAGLEL